MRSNRQTSPSIFFRMNPVFRFDEFVEHCYPGVPAADKSVSRALSYHVSAGNLINIRRGLYAVAPLGSRPKKNLSAVNSFHVAAKLAPDAVLAYHTALEFLGSAYSLGSERVVLTASKAKPFRSGGVSYRPVPHPKGLDSEEKRTFGIKAIEHGSVIVRVTTLERTLVDLLDRPEFSGGWEELWKSFEAVGYLNIATILRHTRNLENATTAARVGWFLEAHRDAWMIPESDLEALSALAPRNPTYLLRSDRRPGKLLPRWNLIVPEDALPQRWEEVV